MCRRSPGKDAERRSGVIEKKMYPCRKAPISMAAGRHSEERGEQEMANDQPKLPRRRQRETKT